MSKRICFVPIDLSHNGGGGGVMQVSQQLADACSKDEFRIAMIGLGKKEKMVISKQRAYFYFPARKGHYYISRLPLIGKYWTASKKEKEWSKDVHAFARFLRFKLGFQLFELIEEGGSKLSRFKAKWNLKLVMRAHGTSFSWKAHSRATDSGLLAQRKIQLKAFKEADCIVVPSEKYKRQLEKESQKLTFRRIWNPIRFQTKADSKGKEHFLFLGRIQDIKGWELLLDAAGILKEKGYQFKVLFAGNWSNRAEQKLFEEKVSALDLESTVQIGQSQRNVEELFSNSIATVFPSKWESFGLVPLESIANGTPAIATRVGAMPELFPEVSEMNLEAGNAESLAHQMESLLDPVKRRALLEKEQMALKRLDSEEILKENIQMYNELLHGL